MNKQWYESRTIWFNVLSGVVAIATALQAPDVGLNPKVVSIFSSIVTAGNILLRMVTDKSIGGDQK